MLSIPAARRMEENVKKTNNRFKKGRGMINTRYGFLGYISNKTTLRVCVFVVLVDRDFRAENDFQLSVYNGLFSKGFLNR